MCFLTYKIEKVSKHMKFSLNNVSYKISLSSTKSENNGISSLETNAKLRAGQKRVVLEKILLDGETVRDDIHGEGPGMDDETERKRFAMVVIGQLQRHAREMNETDQLKQSLTSFLKLYKQFFKPRLLSLLEENQESLTSNSGADVRDGDEDSQTSSDDENDSNN